jgi:hypothetical protein
MDVNLLVIVKLNGLPFEQWREIFQDDAEFGTQFMRKPMICKVDEEKAIFVAHVFDLPRMKKVISSPVMLDMFETLGIQHTFYHLTPDS